MTARKRDYLPVVHFTVSMWNRAKHLQQLVRNLRHIANVDRQIALHVSFFESDDIDADSARRLIEDGTGFPARMVHLTEPFNNGYGHNVAAASVPVEDIVCVTPVDMKLPLDIVGRVRANVEAGKKFYGPKSNNEDEAGKLHPCDYAYTLTAMSKQDFLDVGGYAQNKKWGGDGEKSEGGEDVVMCKRLREAGLEEIRPYERDVICRWHPRDITSEFYSTLPKYKKKPWWTLVDGKGKPAKFKN